MDNEIDQYINNFSADVQKILRRIRTIIRKKAPHALETLNYGMPAYKLKGKSVVYFAGYKNHIGLYATPSGHVAFDKELSKYKRGKGSVQFPLDQPVPFGLIGQMVEFRVAEIDPDYQNKLQ